MRQGPAGQPGTLTYLHGDHLGSTSLVTNDTGGFVARVLYYPYGETRYEEGTLPTDYGFTGQRRDSYLDTYSMGAREYDPSLGRWLSADSIVPDPANPQSLNRYAYVRNNPLKYVDPTGHFERDVIKQILIDQKIASEGGTEEDWEDWAEGVMSDWEQDAEWWELLRKAEVGDVFDGLWFTPMFSIGGGEADRWIGQFVEGRDGKIYFKYRVIEADFFGHEPYWECSADQLLEILPNRGLDEFYGDGELVDILLLHQGSDGNYAAFAGTGAYYMPHLGYDSPRINVPKPDYWRDYAMGCAEVFVGAWGGPGLIIAAPKAMVKFDRYFYEKGALGRLQVAYGY
jgi:RHS repeat-associated protein